MSGDAKEKWKNRLSGSVLGATVVAGIFLLGRVEMAGEYKTKVDGLEKWKDEHLDVTNLKLRQIDDLRLEYTELRSDVAYIKKWVERQERTNHSNNNRRETQ